MDDVWASHPLIDGASCLRDELQYCKFKYRRCLRKQYGFHAQTRDCTPARVCYSLQVRLWLGHRPLHLKNLTRFSRPPTDGDMRPWSSSRSECRLDYCECLVEFEHLQDDDDYLAAVWYTTYTKVKVRADC